MTDTENTENTESTQNAESSQNPENIESTQNTERSPAPPKRVAGFGKLWWVGLVAFAAAFVANLIFYYTTNSLFDEFAIPFKGDVNNIQPIPVQILVVFILVPTLLATILLAILGRFAANPFRIFWIIAIIGFLASFLLPFGLPHEVSSDAKIGLSIMHVIVFPIIALVLTRLGRK
ncbi:MAG: hypothetical protein IIA45_10605 [Bacteroidetes bacterium]|nr:hypothetical protein [Bacteroidota bacterium]